MGADSRLLRWLDRTGAGERTRRGLDIFRERTSATFAQLGEHSEDALGMATAHLVAFSAMMELLRQIHTGQKADREGLRLVGRFLKAHPHALEHLRKNRPAEPELAEQYNVLLARAQAEARR